jgi:hypothetical protein
MPMRLVPLALILATLLAPALALAECGDHQQAAPAATIAETPGQTTPAAACPGGATNCPAPPAQSDRQAVASTTDTRTDTAPRR